jgi:hypothetical protein
VQNTDYEFTLPRGFVDEAGNLHNVGVMRLATSLDEIAPLSDARVQANEGYMGILLLSRVLKRLGGFSPVPVALRVFARFVHSNQLWGWQFTSVESGFN